MFNKGTESSIKLRERGSALLLTMVAVCILAVIGGSFALMLQSEARSVKSNILAQQALYVAESGIQDVLFQRSKRPADMCFPFFFYDENLTETERLDEIKNITQARSGGIDSAPTGTCDPTVDSIPEDVSTQELPCWPYNEELYANYIHFAEDGMPNDGFTCHDGSNQDVCPNYDPLLWWPAKESDGTIGWKDMDDSLPVPLPDMATSSGQRYTTGFFTLCNDSFEGIAPTDPGWDMACLAAKGGGRCNQNVIRLSIVSVGEVQMGKKVVRRAVKVDLAPPSLYSGVIDKYVDMTLMYQTNINGPLHINGWWNANKNKYSAFLLSLSLSVAPIAMWLDPPEMVSVSYPEDPDNPDWQPSSLIGGFTFSHDIVYVHLPVRIEIPQVNWAKWEDRMKALYDKARAEYSDTTVYALHRCKYKAAVRDTSGDCGDSGAQYFYDSGGNKSDDKMDANMPKFMSSMSPSPSPYNTGEGRIHNLERYKSDAQVWSASGKYIFDLFDHWNPGSPSYVEGTESSHVNNNQDPGPMDKSLLYKRKFILDPNFNLGCLTCVISNGISLDAFMFCCVGKKLNRNEFWFMGKHEFRDFVFVDGVIGIGYRTPYHTCGGGDGKLGVYCIVIPEITLFWPLDFISIPSWKFGLPHWHMGAATVKGEMLINGRLYMADWIHIDGGTIYTDGHIIKDETSGYDVTIHLDVLLCWIMTGFMGDKITIDLGIFGTFNICDIIMGILNPIISALVPWWPTMDLTNNSLIDFESYLDIDGIGPDNSVVNPGTLYTRGDFRLQEPGWDAIAFLGNALLGYFLPFLELTPSMDPIRIYNGGAIVAGGWKNGSGNPAYKDGNIWLANHKRADILTYDPENKKRSVGYVLARGGLKVYGDIVSQYGWAGLLDSCSTWAGNGLDEDCAAAGIFYSGGIAAGTNSRNMYSRRGMDLGVPFGQYDYEMSQTCLPEDDGFWEDPLGQGQCWLVDGLLGDILGGNAAEHNIRGHVFAGSVGAMPGLHFRLDQDSTVRNDAVRRQYFKQLGGVPINWQELEAPNNLPSLVN